MGENAGVIRECFTGLYPLDESEVAEEAVKRALEDPMKFVLKPQREGGGNNIYGEKVAESLRSMSVENRRGFILMELISPEPQKVWMVRGGEATEAMSVSELGIYGVWVRYFCLVMAGMAGMALRLI